MIEQFLYGVAAVAAAILIIYVVARVVSAAFFHEKRVYMKGIFNSVRKGSLDGQS